MSNELENYQNALEIHRKLTKRAEEVANIWVKAYTGSSYGVYATNVTIDVARKVISFGYKWVDGVAIYSPYIEIDIKCLEDNNDAALIANSAREKKERENRVSEERSKRIAELENTEIFKEWQKLKNEQNPLGITNYFSPQQYQIIS